MAHLPTWQWSLKSMFELISGCAVMAAWLRLRIAFYPSWNGLGWTSPLEYLAFGCLVLWIVQTCRVRGTTRPRCELLALALLLCAIETTRGVLNYYMTVSGHIRAVNIQASCNANAVMGYGFAISCTLASVLALPCCRRSVMVLWFLTLVAAVSINVGLLIYLCNVTATAFENSTYS